MGRGFVLLWLFFLARCTPYETTVVVVATPACGVLALPDNRVECHIINDNQYLLRTNEGISLTYQALNMTINGTLYMRFANEGVTLIVLEGTTIASAQQTTRIIPEGAQWTLEWNSVTALSAPVPFDKRDLNEAILQILPTDFAFPTPIAPPADYTARPSETPTATPLSLTDIAFGTATPEATVCAPRLDWSGRYTVRRGDLLSNIARIYGITLDDLQTGNCITDPNRIPVGLTLNVPNDVTLEPSATLTVEATLTPSAVAFRADKDSLKAGECTTLRWDVFNISAVFIEESTTTGNNLIQVCPTENTTYTLRVVYPDGTQTTHLVNIEVTP